MPAIATSIQAGFEPIAGYVLREKLGAGGYGEVWLADAPGGLKKAIKFVHGSIDEDRASNELKSLQRIRQVHHPFILSLERIEVIHGQLIIVTELAQGSLHDKFNEFREKGFAGILREKLLGYMRDAADGLDFLCQEHDLQHLDVKPANLLLVADRVKVADFGLIKDVQSASLSMMSGLTPTYAAPEMFDGRPGRFSDQYSLAIVYQELLTGSLPFRGRTTAQLANEHLRKAPNLESIPLAERPILSKALSKKPQLRFSNCREFIDALERAHLAIEPTVSPEEKPAKIKPRPVVQNRVSPRAVVPTSESSRRLRVPDVLTQKNSLSGIVARPAQNILTLPAMPEAAEIALRNGQTTKEYVIGIGETGVQIVLGLRRKLLDQEVDLANSSHLGFLILDTDSSTIEKSISRDRAERLPYHAVVHIPLKTPQYYRDASTSIYGHISRRWVYNIPRSLKTEGVRPLGMLAFLDHAAIVYNSIQETLAEIAGSLGQDNLGQTINVRLVGSVHGGTGGALFSEVGFLLRQIASDLELSINIELVTTCASANGATSTDLQTASAMSCISEINHYFVTDGLHPAIDSIPVSHAVNKPPFDKVILLYGGQCGNAGDWNSAITQGADFLWSLWTTDLGMRIQKAWSEDEQCDASNSDHHWTSWVSSVCVKPIEVNSNVVPELAASRTCLKSVLPWISSLAIVLDAQRSNETESHSPSKVDEQMDFFVGDMFRSNHWTAQAWVHQCMSCLVEQVTDEGSCEVAEPNSSDTTVSTLPNLEKEAIVAVCDQLAIASHVGESQVARLFDETRGKLADWIGLRWMSGPLQFSHMRKLCRLVSSKFSVNANSLRVVAEKLSAKHDATLDSLYKGEVKPTPELDQQLKKTALEARFHTLAAMMLARLSEHMIYVEDLWLKESACLQKELCKWGMEMAKRIGVPWNSSPESQLALSAIARSNADDLLTRLARKSLLEYCRSKIAESLMDSAATPAITSLNEIYDKLISQIQIEKSSTTSKNTKVNLISEIETSSPNTEITFAQITSTGATLASTGSANEKPGLAAEFDSARPFFVEFGGAVRNAIILPKNTESQLEAEQKHDLVEKQATVLVSTNCKTSQIVCFGERLALDELVDHVWLPSSDVWHLSHRLQTRVDVDWIPLQHVEGE